MIIEQFDFKNYFNTKNVTQNPRIKSYGIGATSIITSTQAITRLNIPDVKDRIPGLGNHDETEEYLAKSLFSSSTETVSTQDFLNAVIRIHYASNSSFEFVIIKPPSFKRDGRNNQETSTEYRISKEMYEGLEGILQQLEDSGTKASLISEQEGVEYYKFQDYESIKDFFRQKIDSNFIFPFQERIIAQQQDIQGEYAEER